MQGGERASCQVMSEFTAMQEERSGDLDKRGLGLSPALLEELCLERRVTSLHGAMARWRRVTALHGAMAGEDMASLHGAMAGESSVWVLVWVG